MTDEKNTAEPSGASGGSSRQLLEAVRIMSGLGNTKDVEAIVAVDHLMREYAFTDDPLDRVAEKMAVALRALAYSWMGHRQSKNTQDQRRLRRPLHPLVLILWWLSKQGRSAYR